MSHQETITAALLNTFNANQDDPQAVAGAAAALIVAFADVLRGPAPVIGEPAATQLVADETSALILVELRKQTTLLEVIAKQGDRAGEATRTVCGDAAHGLPG